MLVGRKNEKEISVNDDYFLNTMGVTSENKIQESSDSIEATLIKKQLQEEKNGKNCNHFIPKRPNITTGLLHTHDSMKALRYFVLEPFKNSLTKYVIKADCPEKPFRVYPLNKITQVKELKSINTDSKHPIYALEFMIMLSKYKCYSHSRNIILAWIETIRSAIIFSAFLKNIEEKIKTCKELDEAVYMLKSTIQQKTEIEDQQIALPTIQPDSPMKSPKKIEFTPEKKDEERPQPMSLTKIIAEDKQITLDSELKEDSKYAVNFASFVLMEKIGEGAFGKIFKVRKKDTGVIYAMKVLSKEFLQKQDQLKYAVVECNVLKLVNHPFIMKLHWSFQTNSFLYFILDYCGGGDLEIHLARRGLFEEKETRFFIAELILAIEYLHSKHVIYRDLKPGNILLDESGHIRLGDFGLAKENMKDGDLATTFCGSPVYVPPELIAKKGAGKAADIYQIGAVMYEMIVGFPPFFADNIEGVYKSIEKNDVEFPDFVSATAKTLLSSMLSKDPSKRLTLDEIKSDDFFRSINWDNLYKKKVKPPFGKDEINNDSGDEDTQMV